ncbi:lysM domain receptor-like kinase 4 [Olea europaea var. sylvestris]|uniref:lysM domain receptor-like kinase 4 n=1 Tax=Olea europaea var. sylvestris TaxID=158386 RepID=UPI000C1D562B|nr:lysM domain receptor-like kinase 4 [Olea europaea var. sylvestris]
MRNGLPGFFIVFNFFLSSSLAQQNYSENLALQCNNTDSTGPSSAFLYTCNGAKSSCKAFLLFRTRPPYVSVSSISNLTSSDPLEFALLNNISNSDTLPPDQDVVVPITCSCSGQYYQANTSYVSQVVDDTYFTIANNTYQGLTTCNALMRENQIGELDLYPGLKLQVPLRCACPTNEQIVNGTKFLLTYLVTWKDKVPAISRRFNVSNGSLVEANGFSDKNSCIYPFTTILIPLPTEPLNSQIRTYHQTFLSNPSPVTPQKKHKRSSKGLHVGIGTGASFAVFCFALSLGFFYHRKKRSNEGTSNGRQGKKLRKLQEQILDKVAGIGEMLKIYSFEELEAAAGNFIALKKLSNSVHRGVLRGKSVAIKKTSTDVTKEIEILSKISHFNLISLYGVCEHDGDFYLVYEFMENGSLKEWLHKENRSHVQSWNYLIRIALDVANGLHYLHNFSSPAYVHGDINSCNILLNGDLRAKIANFSLARIALRERNGNSITSCVFGAKGYMAPEYLRDGNVTPKIDVYAFGVVLLELITGKEAVFVENGEEVFLSATIMSAVDGISANAEIEDLIDPCLQVKNSLGFIIDQTELAVRLVKLSFSCLAREPENRLSMAEVVSALMKIQLDVQNSESYSIEVELH